MTVTTDEAADLLYALSPHHYVESLGLKPYEWQRQILRSGHKRKIINGARQAGKSTIVSAKPCHTAKYYAGSVSLIVAATEQQAFYDMEKVKGFVAMDAGYPKVKRSSDRLITLENGSMIMVVPATEKAARGPSAPRLIMLDEASRIDDIVYRSGVIPMLTDNPDCELINISTPNGREGFFYKSFNNNRWERYEVRSPFESDVFGNLNDCGAEAEYRKRRAEQGIRGFYSPRHFDRNEQAFNLSEMGHLMYRQEYCVEFVEPEDQVFGYDEIERLMSGGEAEDMFAEIGEAEPFTF